MKCISIRKYLPAYIDKQLTCEMNLKIEKHLETCSRCKEKYQALLALDNNIHDIYSERELPEGFEESMINNVCESLVQRNWVTSQDNSSNRNHYKNKERTLKFGAAAAVILFMIFLSNWQRLFEWTQGDYKGDPVSLLEHEVFHNVKEAQNYVKEIPFLPPTYIPEEYKLKTIDYSKTIEMEIKLEFLYEDNNYDELRVDYTLKGKRDYDDSIMKINPISIKVETDAGYSPPKGVKITKENHASELTQKYINIDLGKYTVGARINYNYKVPDSDKTDDCKLIKIVQSYLNTDICSTSEENKQTSVGETQIYSSFEELKKQVPKSVPIVEPSYIPGGFKLKNIAYKMVNPDINFFIIDVFYENNDQSMLIIDYRLPGKGGVHQNNTDRIQTYDSYILKTKQDGKGELDPVTEKNLPYMNSIPVDDKTYTEGSNDLNIFLMYNDKDSGLLKTADDEIKKVLDGIKKLK